MTSLPPDALRTTLEMFREMSRDRPARETVETFIRLTDEVLPRL